MIEYVHRRLGAWGEWSMSRVDGGAGISLSQCAYEESVPGGHDSLSAILANTPCLEIEMGVAHLCQREPRMGEIVCGLYRDSPRATAEALADSLRLSLRTYWRYLDRSHWLLLDWLNGRAIGECDEEAREAWAAYVARMPRIVACASTTKEREPA